MDQINIFIVDNEKIAIDALAAVLQLESDQYVIAGSAINGEMAINEIPKVPKVDIVIMDLVMQPIDGLKAMTEILAQYKYQTPPIFIFFSYENNWDIAHRVIDAGASAYVIRTSSNRFLFYAIEKVLEDPQKVIIDPEIKRPSTKDGNTTKLLPVLTDDERKIIVGLLKGLSAEKIAKSVDIGKFKDKDLSAKQKQTIVESIIDQLKAKSQTKTQAHLIRFVLENQLCIDYEIYKNQRSNIPRLSSQSEEIPYFIIDDHDSISTGLPFSIATMSIGKQLKNIGAYSNPEEGLSKVLEWCASSTVQEVAILLLDIQMPGIDGITISKKIRAQYDQNKIKIIFFTSNNDYEQAFKLLYSAGFDNNSEAHSATGDAQAYVFKNIPIESLIYLFKAVYHGHTYLDIPKPQIKQQFDNVQYLVLWMLWNGLTRPQMADRLLVLDNMKAEKINNNSLKEIFEKIESGLVNLKTEEKIFEKALRQVDYIKNECLKLTHSENSAGLINYIWRNRLFESFNSISM